MLRGGCRAVMIQVLRGWNVRSFSNTVPNIKAGVFTTTPYRPRPLFLLSAARGCPRRRSRIFGRRLTAARLGLLLLVPIQQSLKPSRLAFSATGRYDFVGVGLPLTCVPAPLFLPSEATRLPSPERIAPVLVARKRERNLIVRPKRFRASEAAPIRTRRSLARAMIR